MLEPLSHSIRRNHPCTISFSRIEGSDSWLLTLFGTLQTFMAAKATPFLAASGQTFSSKL